MLKLWSYRSVLNAEAYQELGNREHCLAKQVLAHVAILVMVEEILNAS